MALVVFVAECSANLGAVLADLAKQRLITHCVKSLLPGALLNIRCFGCYVCFLGYGQGRCFALHLVAERGALGQACNTFLLHIVVTLEQDTAQVMIA